MNCVGHGWLAGDVRHRSSCDIPEHATRQGSGGDGCAAQARETVTVQRERGDLAGDVSPSNGAHGMTAPAEAPCYSASVAEEPFHREKCGFYGWKPGKMPCEPRVRCLAAARPEPPRAPYPRFGNDAWQEA